MAGRNVTIVAGVSSSGKSTFALRYLVNAKLTARFLFDPDAGEFNPRLGEFADRLKLPPARDVYELGLALCDGWVPYDPHHFFPGRPEVGFQFFCEWAFEKCGEIPGEKVLVVDEAWQYCSPQSIPQELANVARTGRKVGLRLMIITQEPNRLNASLINAASEVVCFRLQSDPALNTVKRDWQMDPEEIKALAPLHFVARNMDTGGELRGRIRL